MRRAGMVSVILGIVAVIAPVLFDLVFKRETFTLGPKSAASIIAGVVLVIAGSVMMRKEEPQA